MTQTYLSVCSGIEAASVAWHPLGWQPEAFAETEKFPSAVLAHHYPSIPNLGDMTKFKDWPNVRPSILVGGTPCQSFSVAGLRKGMDDPRGNLALTYLAILDRYQPEWCVWENVPGVLSSSEGRDFGAFLGGLAELGYGFAYRVLDAQYVRVDGFGRAVPQRRRRVFVVGNSGDWRRAAAVLFERESLSWHTAPRRETGERVAPTISARPSGGGGLGTDFDCDGGLVPSISHPLLAKGNDSFDDSLQTYVGRQVSHCLNAGGMGRQDYETETETETVIAVAHALRGEGFDASEDGTGLGTPLVPVMPLNLQVITRHEAMGRGTGFGLGEIGEPAYTLSKTLQHAIAFSCKDNGAAYTLEARTVPQAVATAWAVRRLTPTECERLQGFPDEYTNVPWRGKNGSPDGPRYKALGNSMAVNVMRWLGRRIEMASTVPSQDRPAYREGEA